MLVLFNLFAERAVKRHFYATRGFFWNRGIWNKRKTKIDSLRLTFEIYGVMTHFCIITVNHRGNAISALRILMTDFLQTLKVDFGRVKVQNFFGKCFTFLRFNSVLDGRLLDCVTRLWTYGKNFSEFRKRKFTEICLAEPWQGSWRKFLSKTVLLMDRKMLEFMAIPSNNKRSHSDFG